MVLLGYGFYQWNPWLIILVPCVLLVIYPIAWGMNEELTDDECATDNKMEKLQHKQSKALIFVVKLR